jgi:hypothetical protein
MNMILRCKDENMTSTPPTSQLKPGVVHMAGTAPSVLLAKLSALSVSCWSTSVSSPMLAGTRPSGLLDGNFETPAGTNIVMDTVLNRGDEATTSTPLVSGQKQNSKHLVGTVLPGLVVSWLISLAKTSVEQVVGVTASGLRAMICSMDGEIETPAGTGTIVDAVLNCRGDATTSRTPMAELEAKSTAALTPPSMAAGVACTCSVLGSSLRMGLIVTGPSCCRWLALLGHISCGIPSTHGFKAPISRSRPWDSLMTTFNDLTDCSNSRNAAARFSIRAHRLPI